MMLLLPASKAMLTPGVAVSSSVEGLAIWSSGSVPNVELQLPPLTEARASRSLRIHLFVSLE